MNGINILLLMALGLVCGIAWEQGRIVRNATATMRFARQQVEKFATEYDNMKRALCSVHDYFNDNVGDFGEHDQQISLLRRELWKAVDHANKLEIGL